MNDIEHSLRLFIMTSIAGHRCHAIADTEVGSRSQVDVGYILTWMVLGLIPWWGSTWLTIYFCNQAYSIILDG